ncbi:MAG: acetoacetate--CoA ligase [Mycobacteriaceae bacterium]
MDTLWRPRQEQIDLARVTDFTRFVNAKTGLQMGNYPQLQQWSVDNIAEFWQLVWEYFNLKSYSPASAALVSESMPGAQWFPGATLNYVDQIFRHEKNGPAIIAASENTVHTVSWQELVQCTAALAAALRSYGVQPGDRVAGYLPNIAEAVIAFLATASLGATWAACGQDYTASAACDRLHQLAPKVLIAADGYRYGGTEHNKTADIVALREVLTSVEKTIVIDHIGAQEIPEVISWRQATEGEHALIPVPVPFDHPLWTVFSSGTTGIPKGIVHGHGGVLLEHLKSVALHMDIDHADVFWWYTSPSWMMWNMQVAGLLVGATIVCYDGSPSYPGVDGLWKMAAELNVSVLGTSPGYVLASAKAGAEPAKDYDLSALKSIGITGSAMPATSSLWLSQHVGEDIPVYSISGGTDIVAAFVGGVPTMPVWPGELSVPCLGVALDAYNDQAESVRGVVGELVVTKPMPSMPVKFWNDPQGLRYQDAYFATYPGVWRHGDWITITERGSVIVHGRSDSTLNRNGIRMGSADIYQAVEALPEISEALVIGAEQADGGYRMPLFVVLADDVQLNDELVTKICTAIREQASPRHVPDEVRVAPGIPHTRTGKKLEVPIKRILQGADPHVVVDRTAVDDPQLLDWYQGQHRKD